jgi:hypothetical protein
MHRLSGWRSRSCLGTQVQERNDGRLPARPEAREAPGADGRLGELYHWNQRGSVQWHFSSMIARDSSWEAGLLGGSCGGTRQLRFSISFPLFDLSHSRGEHVTHRPLPTGQGNQVGLRLAHRSAFFVISLEIDQSPNRRFVSLDLEALDLRLTKILSHRLPSG